MPRGRRRVGKGKRRGRPSALSVVSTTDLQRELSRRQSALDGLMRRRDELSDALAELESEIQRYGGTGRRGRGRPRGVGMRRGPGRPPGSGKRRGRRGRGRNAANLVQSLRSVLNGKTMSVTEVSDAVRKAGYKTSSPNFRTIVNQALLANPDVFKKVARGQYTAR